MTDAFHGAAPDDIVARIQAAVGGASTVRVGEEAHGYRNVGIDLPPGGRSAIEARMLRLRVREALERAGVSLAEMAIAPRVPGDIRGSVRVQAVAVSWRDGVGAP